MGKGLWIGLGLAAGAVGGVVYALTREEGVVGTAAEVVEEVKRVFEEAKKEVAERGVAVALDFSALGQAIRAAKAVWSIVPSDELLRLAAQAVAPFAIPLDVFMAFMRNESSLRTKGVFRQEKNSYAKWKDRKAPGSDKTWGQLYSEADWGSYGPMQLMIFNFVGTPGGLTPGEPLAKGHDPLFNFTQAARLINDLWKKYGNWKDVFSAYNSNLPFGKVTSSMFYTLHVATYLRALGIGGIIDNNDVAALRTKIAEARAKGTTVGKPPKLQADAWQADLDKFLALNMSPGAPA